MQTHTHARQSLSPPLLNPWLALEPNIVQLVAISGEDTFNAYICPERNIDKPTTVLSLYSPYQKSSPPTLHKALASFISFLRSLKQPVRLASHSSRSNKFALDRALFRCLLTRQFQQLVSKMLDTLRLSKALFPGLSSYEREVLSYPFLGNCNNAYNALKNVTDLQEPTVVGIPTKSLWLKVYCSCR